MFEATDRWMELRDYTIKGLRETALIPHGTLSSSQGFLSPGNAKMGDGGAEAIAKGLNRGPKAIVWLQLQDGRVV